MNQHNFKKGDKVKVISIKHTAHNFGRNEAMYNVEDTFIIEYIDSNMVIDDKNFTYHPDDLELVIDEIFEINRIFNFDKFLDHLNLQIIKR